jgi:hypothetical protein
MLRIASMPTVCASVPMQPPTTTSLRRNIFLTSVFTSVGDSSGYSRSTTVTSSRSRMCLAEPYTTKKVNSVPMPCECTTIAGSRPIFAASCSAAPSAFGPGGTGNVNEACTMPSPVVSPYGRT